MLVPDAVFALDGAVTRRPGRCSHSTRLAKLKSVSRGIASALFLVSKREETNECPLNDESASRCRLKALRRSLGGIVMQSPDYNSPASYL